MSYSICSDLYRIEDNDPSFPLCGSSSADDGCCPYDDKPIDYYDPTFDDCSCEYDDYIEPDWEAEFYAANDPSNWD